MGTTTKENGVVYLFQLFINSFLLSEPVKIDNAAKTANSTTLYTEKL